MDAFDVGMGIDGREERDGLRRGRARDGWEMNKGRKRRRGRRV